METASYLDSKCSSPKRWSKGIDYWKVSLFLDAWMELMGSMNGEVRIWDVRAPEKPLYESVAQSHGLAGLAVHAGAPVLATYVCIPSRVSSMLISRTSAPSHDLRQRLVIQGFSDPTKPKTLSRLSIPLSPHVGGPQRPVGFMPSAASLAFHPVSILVPLFNPGAGIVNVKRGIQLIIDRNGGCCWWFRYKWHSQDVPVPNARDLFNLGTCQWRVWASLGSHRW